MKREELVMVPRWKTAKTNEDFEALLKGFNEFCSKHDCCESCDYCGKDKPCDYLYLTEMIVKEE